MAAAGFRDVTSDFQPFIKYLVHDADISQRYLYAVFHAFYIIGAISQMERYQS